MNKLKELIRKMREDSIKGGIFFIAIVVLIELVLIDYFLPLTPEEFEARYGKLEPLRPVEVQANLTDVEPVAEPEPEPQPVYIDLLSVGDVLLHKPIEQAAKQDDGTFNFDAIFEKVKDDIEAADLAIANQEVIIGGEELKISGFPKFNAPYEAADALVKAGFDVALSATNHALDRGKQGIINCLNNWHEKYPDMMIVGLHDSAEDQERIRIYEKDGFKVALLNYTYGTNLSELKDMPYAVDYLKKDRVLKDIQWAEENADFTIVFPHWGTEYSFSIDKKQAAWSKFMLANGVDLVIGTHPHVIQPVEMLEDEEGHKMLIYYSLGNFINSTGVRGKNARRMIGGMAKVRLKKDVDGTVSIDSYEAIPLVSHVEYKTNGIVCYKLSDYTRELADANMIVKVTPNFSYDYCYKLVNYVWGEAATTK